MKLKYETVTALSVLGIFLLFLITWELKQKPVTEAIEQVKIEREQAPMLTPELDDNERMLTYWVDDKGKMVLFSFREHEIPKESR